jgi:hypothetical protein
VKEAPAIIALTRKHHPFSGIVLGLGIYLVGLLLSAVYGALSYFLMNWLFAGCCTGIIVFTWVGGHCFLSLDEIVKELKSNFAISKSEFFKNEQDFRKAFANDKIGLLFSLPGLAMGVYYTLALLVYNLPQSMIPPRSIYGNIVFDSYMLALFLFSGYLIFFAVQTMMRVFIFLRTLAKHSVKLNLLQVGRKINLKKTNNTLLILAIGWFVGVSLIMTTVLAFATAIIIIYLIFVTIFGLLIFIIPQTIFHQSIRRSKEALLRNIESSFSSKVSLPIDSGCDSQRGLLLCMLFDQVNLIGEWPLDISLLLQLLVSAAIPIVTAILSQLHL